MIDARPLIRVATAGSVDDGKSTLIGRLLYDSQSILEDQFEAVERASRQTGEQGVNLALLTDGLKAERTQKITIDVAYRPFATTRRRYLLADTPGHAQYTRNMFTGMSTADVAILLADAERGPTPQTHRHLFLTSLLRVPHVVVAINKMDLVGYREEVFEKWAGLLREYASALDFADLRFMPMSALEGEGIVEYRGGMPWFKGPSILEYLDSVELASGPAPHSFRFPVQFVLRPDRTLRALAGEAVSGSIRVGETVAIQPSGQTAKVKAILTPDGETASCDTGEPVLIELDEEIDVGRGDMLVRERNRAVASRSFEALVCWMDDAPLRLGSHYRVLHTTRDSPCEVTELVYRLNPETLHREEAKELGLNDIGRILLRSGEPLCIDLFENNRATGCLVLVDGETNQVAAAGIVTRIQEAGAGQQGGKEGIVVWMTGLSGAGKTTISDLAAEMLRANGQFVVQLDGDRLRAGLNSDLGFSESDRDENIRRCAEIAKLLANQGAVVICSLISPMKAQRFAAREIVGDQFLEVFVSCPLETLKTRDPKGLYKRALSGEIPEFTGVSAPYEEPDAPDLILDTEASEKTVSVKTLVDRILLDSSSAKTITPP
jgi:bifunctional enzyme CysN/CysC